MGSQPETQMRFAIPPNAPGDLASGAPPVLTAEGINCHELSAVLVTWQLVHHQC